MVGKKMLDFLKKKDKKNKLPEVNNDAKLIAFLRQTTSIDIVESLPAYRGVMSNTFGITGNDLSLISVLDLGQREVSILVSDKTIGQKLYFNVRNLVLKAGYLIRHESSASIAIIVKINNAISSETSEKFSSDVKPLIDEILTDAVNKSGTDIHICCRETSAMILFRRYGRIAQYKKFDILACEQIAGYMFTNMAEPSSRSIGQFSLDAKSLSCAIKVRINDDNYKLRYQFVGAADGWDLIVRVLPTETTNSKKKTFIDLGYEDSQIKLLEIAASKAVGLIAITGPTGSGKSTTLKVMMEFDDQRFYKKRYSVEDPVEYKIFGVTQISLQRDNHKGEKNGVDSFGGALKDLLRSDPNDIMIGEIRDKQTADMMADFVLTGHKIFTTLHTNSAMGSILRLNRLGLDRHILSDKQFISALVFQRLLPVLCPDCKVPAVSSLNKELQNVLIEKFKLDISSIFSTKKDGCDCCGGMGVINQTVVAEVVIPDGKMRAYIRDGDDELAELHWREGCNPDFSSSDMTGKTAFEHAIYKVSIGMVDPLDVEHSFESFNSYDIKGIYQ